MRRGSPIPRQAKSGDHWGRVTQPCCSPGKALTSMTACCPVWLLMMMSIPKSDTPSACRRARDSSRITSSLGLSNTPSILSSCQHTHTHTQVRLLWLKYHTDWTPLMKSPAILPASRWHQHTKAQACQGLEAPVHEAEYFVFSTMERLNRRRNGFTEGQGLVQVTEGRKHMVCYGSRH